MRENRSMKKGLLFATVIMLVLAVLDLLGLLAALFVDTTFYDVNPVVLTLIVNQWILIILGIIAIQFFCPSLRLGLGLTNLKGGLKKTWKLILMTVLLTFTWFAVGVVGTFDYNPTIWNILIDGVLFYVSVSLIEELYIRGLLLNILERLLRKRKHANFIVIIFSSIIFGLVHLFGMLANHNDWVAILTPILWTTALGFY